MKQWVLMLSVAAAAGAAALGADKPKTAVQVVGLQVAKPLPGDKRRQSLTGRKTGTVLTLKVSRPDKYFLGLDAKASRLEEFADDRGTGLVTESSRLLRTWLDGQTWVTRDGRDCLFDLLGLRTPARGARELRVKASLVLKCGRGAVTEEHAAFALQKGGKLTVGRVPLTISNVQVDPNATYVTFTTPRNPEKIAAVQFLDADGKEIETHNLARSVIGFLGNAVYETTYGLKKSVRVVTVRIKHFRQVERLTVPVDVTASVGL
jgi:hypothetical protein